jgi:hypothetical protein
MRSYQAALRDLGNLDRREMGRWEHSRVEHSRVENSHLPFRRRERAMPGFRRMQTRHKSASVHNHFKQERRLVDCQAYTRRPLGRPGRVADVCRLNWAHFGDCRVNRRCVAIRLTAPTGLRHVSALQGPPIALFVQIRKVCLHFGA